nr:MAG TPA: Receptor Binding Protein [Caudoviricetes sp.]
MAEKLKGIPFDANEIILPDGTAGYDNVIFSADFAEWMATYFKNGVLVPGGALISTEMKVTKSDDTHVKVSSGNMVVNGRTAFVPTDVTLAITKAQPNVSRLDRIVVELNIEENVNCFQLKVISGTMSSSPVAPSLTRTEEIYQMSLATVTVGVNGVTQVKDDRSDDDLCGISQVLIGVKPPLPVTGDSAANISYDGSTSGLTGTTVQDAIDELVTDVYYKTLTGTGWSASGTDFVQTISITGFTANMKPPIVDVIPASQDDIDTWGKIWKVETLLNGLKFYAAEPITTALNIVVTKGE